jgi:hypothetical protein
MALTLDQGDSRILKGQKDLRGQNGTRAGDFGDAHHEYPR